MEDKQKTDRAQLAIAYHDKGYNCAQSVCFAFSDKVEIDNETLFRVSEGFGLGMGGMEGTCGAISAATLLAGLKCSTGNLEAPNSKAISYKAAKACLAAFNSRQIRVWFCSLKAARQPLRACPDCIKDSVRIIETLLFDGQ